MSVSNLFVDNDYTIYSETLKSHFLDSKETDQDLIVNTNGTGKLLVFRENEVNSLSIRGTTTPALVTAFSWLSEETLSIPFSGATAVINLTIIAIRFGNLVMLKWNTVFGAAVAATAFSSAVGALPAHLRPTTDEQNFPCYVLDNSTQVQGNFSISTNGIMQFTVSGVSGAYIVGTNNFTATGNAGPRAGGCVYAIN